MKKLTLLQKAQERARQTLDELAAEKKAEKSARLAEVHRLDDLWVEAKTKERGG